MLPVPKPIATLTRATAGIVCFIKSDLTNKTILTYFGCGLPRPFWPNALAIAFLSELFQELDLDLLDLEKPIVLLAQKMVDFLVQMPDFELGFQINLIIVLGA